MGRDNDAEGIECCPVSDDATETAGKGGAGRFSMGRLARATGYSWQGLKAAWRHEQAFREEVVLAGRARDMGSAAVFVALMMVVMTWGLILLT